jgi:uncharacterized phiE125 gp8 family phage protein
VPITVTTPPTDLPVTIDDAKAQCGLLDNTHEELLLVFINAATASIEEMIGAKLMPQTLLITRDKLPRDSAFDLGVFPIQSVDSFEVDSSGNPLTLEQDVDFYAALEGMYPLLAPVSGWPETTAGKPGAVRITVTAGFTDQSYIPKNIQQAILMRVKEMFANRGESVSGVSTEAAILGIDALLDQTRRVAI